MRALQDRAHAPKADISAQCSRLQSALQQLDQLRNNRQRVMKDLQTPQATSPFAHAPATVFAQLARSPRASSSHLHSSRAGTDATYAATPASAATDVQPAQRSTLFRSDGSASLLQQTPVSATPMAHHRPPQPAATAARKQPSALFGSPVLSGSPSASTAIPAYHADAAAGFATAQPHAAAPMFASGLPALKTPVLHGYGATPGVPRSTCAPGGSGLHASTGFQQAAGALSGSRRELDSFHSFLSGCAQYQASQQCGKSGLQFA